MTGLIEGVEGKLLSIHWHAANRTVNSDVFVGLASECLALIRQHQAIQPEPLAAARGVETLADRVRELEADNERLREVLTLIAYSPQLVTESDFAAPDYEAVYRDRAASRSELP